MWNSTLLPLCIKEHETLTLARYRSLITGWCLVLLFPGFALAHDLITLANVADPGQISADEPIAEIFSPEKAAWYLDMASLHWQKSRNCAACHVNMGYMYARPALSSFLEDSGEVRGLFEEYVTKRWKERPPRNIQETVVVASGLTFNDFLMNDQQRAKTLDELFAIQRPDGGWSTPGLLADWTDLKRLDGKPHDTKTSDAYATGFTIIVARELGISSKDPRLRRGIDWLLSNQRVSGKWFCRSPAKDSQHYFSNFGSAFAILALQSCEKLPGWPL